MERRLLKDFQIGLVEGLVQDAISSTEKGPKDVFSKIAKAIGRRTSQGSKKKDWNKVARQRSVVRDPIGSTAEGTERRRQQSVRRHILEHQKDSLFSMDADKLVEYNPRLADFTPAARVAYAKFKIPKIKQEYEENTLQQESVGPDDVFEKAPTVDVVDETNKSSPSIARPRPKSTRKSSPVAGALPFPAVSTGVAGAPKTPEPKEVAKSRDAVPGSDDAAKTPGAATKPKLETPERPGQDGAAGESSRPSTSGPDGQKSETAEKAADGEGGSDGKDPEKTEEADRGTDGDKTADSVQDKDGGRGKDKEEKHLKPESPKRSASPKKPGGKSKVTGEILTGWL